MADITFDIKKLKTEIDNRKNEIASKDYALGKMDGIAPKKGKRTFLNELVTSMQHGVKTNASETIRAVNETVEAKKGVPTAVAKNNNGTKGKYVPPRPNTSFITNEDNNVPTINKNGGDWSIPSLNNGVNHETEREDLFEENLSKANLAFDNLKMNNNPIAKTLINKSTPKKYITEQSEPNNINEEVNNIINEKLDRNLDRLVEISFKNVLTNIYSQEKIDESVERYLQSEKFIKAVGAAINEISKRNKSKHGK